jgi:hypothetical protein
MGRAHHQLQIRDVLRQILRRAPLGFAAIADVSVDEDAVQPRVDVAVGPEGVKAREGFCQGVLDEIFRVGVLSSQPPRLPV